MLKQLPSDLFSSLQKRNKKCSVGQVRYIREQVFHENRMMGEEESLTWEWGVITLRKTDNSFSDGLKMD